MTERQESIQKIKTAYENKQLGFQKGANDCLYYCSKTNSCCAVGVLINPEDRVINEYGNAIVPFNIEPSLCAIDDAMISRGIYTFKGLTIEELTKLQKLHDNLIGYENNLALLEFKDYLYSLK